MKNNLVSLSLGLAVGISILVFSCKKEDPLPSLPDGVTAVENVEEHLTFTEEEEGIPDRVQLVNLPIVLTDTALERSGCRKDNVWGHVAEIPTLHLGGEILSATHVALSGELATISYHLRGDGAKGAVEVVNLSNPKKPKITGQIMFERADVNAVILQKIPNGNKRKVWIAMSDNANGAVLGELMLKGKKFEQDYYRQVKLSKNLTGGIAASANSIVEAGEYLYVTAGKSNGGVFCLRSSDLSLVGFKEFSNAKGVAVDESGVHVAFLRTGPEASVLTDVAGSVNFSTAYPLGEVSHQNVQDSEGGKASISFGNQGSDRIYVATGKNGLKVINLTSGEEQFATPPSMLDNGNTNGISVDEYFSYVANGADGLAIFPHTTWDDPDIDHCFFWDLNEPTASANFVESDGDWIFVAKGEGGFKVLKRPNPEDLLTTCGFDAVGVPDCAETQSNCASLMAALNAVAPINGDLAELHPEYFGAGSSELLLLEDSELELTFLDENSSLTHTIGYYFYPADCPPSIEEGLVGLVAFPNFSEQGGGGGLVSGSTVKMHANFRAGTKIGFFMSPKGWDGSGLVKGQGLYYTNPQYNSTPVQHGLVFYENDCDAIIVAFDQNPPLALGSDYRDAVFQVKVNTPSAVDVHSFVQL